MAARSLVEQYHVSRIVSRDWLFAWQCCTWQVLLIQVLSARSHKYSSKQLMATARFALLPRLLYYLTPLPSNPSPANYFCAIFKTFANCLLLSF